MEFERNGFILEILLSRSNSAKDGDLFCILINQSHGEPKFQQLAMSQLETFKLNTCLFQ